MFGIGNNKEPIINNPTYSPLEKETIEPFHKSVDAKQIQPQEEVVKQKVEPQENKSVKGTKIISATILEGDLIQYVLISTEEYKIGLCNLTQ